MVTIQPVETSSQLEGILELQRRNLRRHLTEAEVAEQGFLIAGYDLAYLEQMHRQHPSVIAVEDGRVVGYALVITREVRN